MASNNTKDKSLDPPTTGEGFSFPFTPYSIQLDFMRNLYSALEDGKFGIFESPTGTASRAPNNIYTRYWIGGKSLSLICGALTWLKDEQGRQDSEEALAQSTQETKKDNNEPDWVLKFKMEKQKEKITSEKEKATQKYNEWVEWIRRKEQNENSKGSNKPGWASRKPTVSGSQSVADKKRKSGRDTTESGATRQSGEDSEDDLVVAEYGSDSETGNGSKSGYSDQVKALLQRYEKGSIVRDDFDDEYGMTAYGQDKPEEPEVTKIFYASRTHSQLSQFMSELKKTKFWKDDQIAAVPLGSRMQLCINDSVRKQSTSVTRMNEKCLDMQQKGGSHRCRFLPKQETPMLDLKDHIKADLMDIEDLAKAGRKMQTCPYYGARNSIRSAKVVTLPYNTLLLESSRKSLGISLKNNIVIIDEAHKQILEQTQGLKCHIHTANHFHAQSVAEVYLARDPRHQEKDAEHRNAKPYQNYDDQRATTFHSCGQYQRLQAGSLNMFVEKFDSLSKDKTDDEGKEKRTRTYGKRRPIKNTTTDNNNNNNNNDSEEKKSQNSNYILSGSATTHVGLIESFFNCLGRPNTDEGRLFLTISTKPRIQSSTLASGKDTDLEYTAEIKYNLLDPSDAFSGVLREARSVILAGGTMKPVDDLIQQLQPRITKTTIDTKNEGKQVKTFECGHVVPPHHIKPIVLKSGPTGKPFQFTYENQSDPGIIKEAGQALANLVSVVRGGVVVFFPSYTCLERMKRQWENEKIIERIEKRKKVYCEPNNSGKGSAVTTVDQVLELYSNQIDQTGGAILFSVVGGKMSEGINFADDMGRAVVMIGLPFPNLRSPELMERIRYIDDESAQAKSSSGSSSVIRTERGRQFYENLCMRAVNQSIGRAIRHANDYAIILFVDGRYASSRISRKLPGWLMPNLSSSNSAGLEALEFGKAMSQAAQFFRSFNPSTGNV